jgi:RNA-binding protein YhbY
MSIKNGKRWALGALGVLILIIAGGIIGFYVTVGILKDKVVEALGPDSEVKDIRVGWTSVKMEGLWIKGSNEWPAPDTLRADQIILVPSLRSLFSGQYRVRSITIINPYLSVYRTKNGKILAIPSLLTKKEQTTARPETVAAKPAVSIGRINIKDGVIELYDATVAEHPLKIRFERIQANMEDLVVPTMNRRSRFDIQGLVKGIHNDGSVDIAGWTEIATKDSSLNLKLRSVELFAFQPYLIKANDTRVRKGTLSLDLQSNISNNYLKALGKITISDLKLAPARGVVGTFMGVPRDAVLALLKDKGDNITLNFTLEGDINNPKFSLNEAITERLAVSMSDVLKVSIGGVTQGAAALGERGVETATGVVRGVGGALQQFLGGPKKH